MTRLLLALPAGLAFAAGPADAQVVSSGTAYVATPGVDDARCILVDPSGIVYVAGETGATPIAGTGPMTGSAYVAAWSAGGTLLWSRTFDTSLGGPERPSALAFDGAGGLYVAGSATNPQLLGWSAFLLRIDAAGSVAWSIERPATSNPEWAPALLVDASGRPILGGRAPSNHGDLSIAAFTPLGVLDWETTHHSNSTAMDQVTHLALAPNGDFVGAGTVSLGSGQHPAVLRVSPSGAIVHATTIWNADVDSGTSSGVCVDALDRTYVASTSTSAVTGWYLSGVMLTALDALGGVLWTRTITGPQQPFGGGATAHGVALDPFGRAIVLGRRAQGSQGWAAVFAAFDRDGNEAWRRDVNDVLGGASTNLWNLPSQFVVTNSGDSIATGLYGPALSDTASDAFVLCVDAAGQRRYGFAYGFPATPGGSRDFGAALATTPGDGIVLVGRAQTGATNAGYDAFVARFARTAVEFCHGDGSGGACPCGNASLPVERAGCANSLGVGARLADLGASSLAADTLVLVGSAMPDSSALYFQGNSALVGVAFGDGLRCAGGAVVRLGVKANSGGASRYPDAGDVPAALRGLVTVPGERVYQIWYRNAAAFCASATFNLSNGLRVTWTP